MEKINTSRAIAWFSWLLLLVTISVLLMQAYHPLWRPHLQADVGVYHMLVTHFLQQGSWSGAPMWYQPGALWFFGAISALSTPPATFDSFLRVFVIANVVLIIAHFYLCVRYGHRYAPLFFLILIFCLGPIVFFRFELLATLLVLSAWVLFQRGRFIWPALLLGAATAVKVYPIVIAPLLVVEAIRQRRGRAIAEIIGAFSIGLALPIGAFILWGGSLREVINSVTFHQLKPVGLEGVWASLITIVQRVMHIPLRITPGYGVHGLTPDLPFLTSELLNSAWLLPTSLTFIYLLWKFRHRGYTDPGIPFVLLSVFVFFSKVLNAHYLWWYFSLLPLIPLYWYSRKIWWAVFSIAVSSLWLTQAVYPLWYTEFVAWFHKQNPDPLLFYLSVVRNIMLADLLLLAWYGIRRATRVQKDRVL